MGLIECYLWPEETWIPLSDCKEGHLYFIAARNSCLGIFQTKEVMGKTCGAFTISRHKFNDNFLFDEYHWDGQFFPTAQPIEDLGLVTKLEGDELLAFLNQAEIDRNIEHKVCLRLVERGKRIFNADKAFKNHPELLVEYLKKVPARTPSIIEPNKMI